MPSSPAQLSPDQRRDELTSLLATGLLRLHARDALPGALPGPVPSRACVAVVGNPDLALSFVATCPFMDTTVNNTQTQENQP